MRDMTSYELQLKKRPVETRLVTDREITPNPLHFVRNHGGIPIIDRRDYSFLLDGLVAEPRSFTLDVAHVVCRCWDNALNTQPPDVRTAWNWGRHVTSSCHRISLYGVNKSRPATSARLAEFESKDIPFAPITVPLAFPSHSWEDYDKYWASHDPRDAKDD
ncbi:hypothetical protein CTA2_11149 [Colletotrichum tanaceti]|uniref:Uncharacterized protein n=1 Tax=Colletotrichum tanaceti TaxID=1306861 RepID=A0A4U6XE88_9PEZI|nr:hypothetical protein CTA2_11149 [Colletotrichum tanaceti]TKW53472.1 hypothetical protein CTA1_13267 [Colletotrichum tanaceti]